MNDQRLELKEPLKLKNKNRGFTLVEILIVLALIGIVAGLAMQNLGGIFGGARRKRPKHGLMLQVLPTLTVILLLLGIIQLLLMIYYPHQVV